MIIENHDAGWESSFQTEQDSNIHSSICYTVTFNQILYCTEYKPLWSYAIIQQLYTFTFTFSHLQMRTIEAKPTKEQQHASVMTSLG